MTIVRSAHGGIPRFRRIAVAGGLPFASLSAPVRRFFNTSTFYYAIPVPDGIWVRVNYRQGHLHSVQMQSTVNSTDITKVAKNIKGIPLKVNRLHDCSIVGVIANAYTYNDDIQQGRSAVDEMERKKLIREVLIGKVTDIAELSLLHSLLVFMYLFNDTLAPQTKPCYSSLSREHNAAEHDGFICGSAFMAHVKVSSLKKGHEASTATAFDVGRAANVVFEATRDRDYPLMGLLYLPDLQKQRYSREYREKRDELAFIQTLC